VVDGSIVRPPTYGSFVFFISVLGGRQLRNDPQGARQLDLTLIRSTGKHGKPIDIDWINRSFRALLWRSAEAATIFTSAALPSAGSVPQYTFIMVPAI
jgi:hypothetical protein